MPRPITLRGKSSPAEPAARGRAAADASSHRLLEALGERVRNLRAARGMSRKSLAQHAGVSERFLASLETGAGNASILLLRRIADALALPLAAVVAPRESSADLDVIVQLLGRLCGDDLAEARRLLQTRFAASAPAAARRARVALVGLRGAGKSTLGKMLAKVLSCPLIELDQKIEALSGMDVAGIHTLLGQSAYRRYELEALKAVVAEAAPRQVIAAPGSIVSEPETYDFLLSHCFTVWIKASPEEHMARVISQGDMRPMSGNREAMNDLKLILTSREHLYARADAIVDTSDRSLDDAFAALRRVVEQK